MYKKRIHRNLRSTRQEGATLLGPALRPIINQLSSTMPRGRGHFEDLGRRKFTQLSRFYWCAKSFLIDWPEPGAYLYRRQEYGYLREPASDNGCAPTSRPNSSGLNPVIKCVKRLVERNLTSLQISLYETGSSIFKGTLPYSKLDRHNVQVERTEARLGRA